MSSSSLSPCSVSVCIGSTGTWDGIGIVAFAGVSQLDEAAVLFRVGGGCERRLGSRPGCLCSRFQPSGSVEADVLECIELPVFTDCFLVELDELMLRLVGTGVRSRDCAGLG